MGPNQPSVLSVVVVITLLVLSIVGPLAALLGAMLWTRARTPAIGYDGAVARFPLAPMDTLNLVSTVIVGVLVAPLPLVSLVLPGIWLKARPTHFELSREGLRIVWPTRSELIPLGTFSNAEVMSLSQLRARVGWGARYGAGGFGGGFGQYLTRTVNFRLYISRLDGLVVLSTRQGPPFILSPSDPAGFQRALASLASGA